MRKLFLTCFSLIVIIVFMTGCFYGTTDVVNGNSNTDNEPDFRQVKWGMSREEVIQIEGKAALRSFSNELYYDNIEVSGDTAILHYEFVNDKLYSASYTFHETDGYSCYLNLLSGLKQKYGEPDYAYDEWASFKGCAAEWYMADTDIKMEIRKNYDASYKYSIDMFIVEIKYISKIDLSNTNPDTDGL